MKRQLFILERRKIDRRDPDYIDFSWWNNILGIWTQDIDEATRSYQSSWSKSFINELRQGNPSDEIILVVEPKGE